MQLSQVVIIILFIVGCSSVPKIQRHTSSTNLSFDPGQYQFHGKVSILKGDDTGKLDKMENEKIEECAFAITAKNQIPEIGANCFEYKVRSTLWGDEIVLKTAISSNTGQCDSYATSESLKDPVNSNIFFVKFNLEFDKSSNPKQFIQSISYGFSGVAKTCTFEN